MWRLLGWRDGDQCRGVLLMCDCARREILGSLNFTLEGALVSVCLSSSCPRPAAAATCHPHAAAAEAASHETREMAMTCGAARSHPPVASSLENASQ